MIHVRSHRTNAAGVLSRLLMRVPNGPGALTDRRLFLRSPVTRCHGPVGENDGHGSNVRGVPDAYASPRSRSCHGFVTLASTNPDGASSMPACSAFNDACGAVEERLDFRDQRLLRRDSRVLRRTGVRENAGDFLRVSRLRSGEP